MTSKGHLAEQNQKGIWDHLGHHGLSHEPGMFALCSQTHFSTYLGFGTFYISTLHSALNYLCNPPNPVFSLVSVLFNSCAAI